MDKDNTDIIISKDELWRLGEGCQTTLYHRTRPPHTELTITDRAFIDQEGYLVLEAGQDAIRCPARVVMAILMAMDIERGPNG